MKVVLGSMGHLPFLAGAWLSLSANAAAQWKVMDLHPSGAAKSSANGAVGGMQGGSVWMTGIGNRAVVWNGSSNHKDLHPFSNGTSVVLAVASGGDQVGVSSHGDVNDDGSSSGLALPCLWRGTAQSWVNLRPAHATSGLASCVSGDQQGGCSFYSSPLLDLTGQHASLWRGTAASHIDLHPKDEAGRWLVMNSALNGIAPGQQVGVTVAGPNQPPHAALWAGSGTSWVDLHPAGASESAARGVGARTQVGWARFDAVRRAGMWSGTPESWSDLSPPGADDSMARAIFGTWQVGYASFGGVNHAVLWTGSAGSWQDLHAFAGSLFVASNAASVWGEGPYLYIAGTGSLASDPSVGHALLWVRCRLDLDINGFVNGDDIDRYGESFDSADPSADFNGDGFVNGDDWDEFVDAFDQGCD